MGLKPERLEPERCPSLVLCNEPLGVKIPDLVCNDCPGFVFSAGIICAINSQHLYTDGFPRQIAAAIDPRCAGDHGFVKRGLTFRAVEPVAVGDTVGEDQRIY